MLCPWRLPISAATVREPRTPLTSRRICSVVPWRVRSRVMSGRSVELLLVSTYFICQMCVNFVVPCSVLGTFSDGGWRRRKIATITEDCAVQPDGVFVVEAVADATAAPPVVGYITTRLNRASGVPGHRPSAEPRRPG